VVTGFQRQPQWQQTDRTLGAALLVALGLLTLAKSALAQTLSTAQASVERARQLEGHGHKDQARELLRRMAALQPNSELLALARADAYLNDKNPFWALKILSEFMAANPPACASRALAARIHIQQANLDQAEQLLDTPGCEQPQETKLRSLLLKAQIAELRGNRTAAEAQVKQAAALRHRYEEDDDQLQQLQAAYDPNRQPAVSWTLDLAGGGTSYGLAGVPVDLAAPRGLGGSTLLAVDLRVRAMFSQQTSLRTFADAELKATQLLATPNRSLSIRQPTVRVGLMLGRGQPRLLAAYAYDLVDIQGGSEGVPGPRIDSEGHRVEYQLTITPWATATGSVGGRLFDDPDRTRFESDHGIVANVNLAENVRLMLGASGHVYKAQRRVYDQAGAAGFLGLDVLVVKGFELRETLSLNGDVFPASRGFFDPLRNERREDLLVRVGTELWSPETHGLRFGAGYAYTNRNSTANDFDFADHRAMLHVQWQSDSEQLSTRRISKQGRIPIRYDDNDAKAATQPIEVREILKQDETVRRSSSCLK
jgi:tetratricopeptide (TPR) repeat protein